MLEPYVYSKITNDTALQTLMGFGVDQYHVYPDVVPRGVEDFDQAITFVESLNDSWPNVKSGNVQFSIFSKTHTKGAEIAQALYDLFHQKANEKAEGVEIVFSSRQTEFPLGFNPDDGLFQRQATYYFKIK